MEVSIYDVDVLQASSGNDSDITSQVASNIDQFTQLSSEHVSLGLSVGCNSDTTDEFGCQDSIGFSVSSACESSNELATVRRVFTCNFWIKAHSSVHQGFAQAMGSLDFRTSAGFECVHQQSPGLYVQDIVDDADHLLWPGSFRQVTNVDIPHRPTITFTACSNVDSVEWTPSVDQDGMTPDPTLRL
ncbi:hypothetical protein P3S67_027226 [Capsicum chacoense]